MKQAPESFSQKVLDCENAGVYKALRKVRRLNNDADQEHNNLKPGAKLCEELKTGKYLFTYDHPAVSRRHRPVTKCGNLGSR